MLAVLFNFSYFLFCLCYLPYVFIRKKWHKDFPFRFGCFSRDFLARISSGPNIWVHAVSVGEVAAVLPLLQEFSKKFPQYRIVLSTVTQSGNAYARQRLGPLAEVIYAPLDFSWIVKKFIRTIKPKIYIAAETELWPNLYLSLKAHSVAVIQINGRISDQSYARYSKFKFLTKRVLSSVDVFCMQSPLDAHRIVELGAPIERVQVVGNLKFDITAQGAELKLESFGYKSTDQILVAGSTHPGEEEILLDIYQALAGKFQNLRLVLAPRHIERSDEVANLVRQNGLKAVKYSLIDQAIKPLDSQSILVVDRIGQLVTFYQLAKMVFIGKTLTAQGGQNMIEPAFFGKTVLVGPHTQNFQDVMRLFLESMAVIQVKDKEELKVRIQELLRSPDKLTYVGTLAKEVVARQKGAALKTTSALSALMASGKKA